MSKKFIIKTIKTLCLALGGFLVLVLLKFQFSYLFTTDNAGINALLNLKKVDLLVIGSSHVRSSYDVKKIEEKTGLSTYALSYAYMPNIFVYRLLKFLVEEEGLQFDQLVIDTYYLMFTWKNEFIDPRFIFDSPPTLKYDALKFVFNHFKSLGLKEYHELLVTEHNELILSYPINNPVVSRFSYRGGYVGKTLGSLSKKQYQDIELPEAMKKVELNSWEFEALDQLLQLLQKHQIKAQFIEAPLPKNVFQARKVKNVKGLVKKIIESAGYTYVDLGKAPPFNQFDHRDFTDDNHLSTRGRDRFTRNLLPLLKK